MIRRYKILNPIVFFAFCNIICATGARGTLDDNKAPSGLEWQNYSKDRKEMRLNIDAIPVSKRQEILESMKPGLEKIVNDANRDPELEKFFSESESPELPHVQPLDNGFAVKFENTGVSLLKGGQTLIHFFEQKLDVSTVEPGQKLEIGKPVIFGLGARKQQLSTAILSSVGNFFTKTAALLSESDSMNTLKNELSSTNRESTERDNFSSTTFTKMGTQTTFINKSGVRLSLAGFEDCVTNAEEATVSFKEGGPITAEEMIIYRRYTPNYTFTVEMDRIPADRKTDFLADIYTSLKTIREAPNTKLALDRNFDIEESENKKTMTLSKNGYKIITVNNDKAEPFTSDELIKINNAFIEIVGKGYLDDVVFPQTFLQASWNAALFYVSDFVTWISSLFTGLVFWVTGPDSTDTLN